MGALILSRVMMRNIRQYLFFAFIYNAVGIPIAAGVLYPLFGILLSPMIAGVAMSLSSVSVITNALRLRGLKLETLSAGCAVVTRTRDCQEEDTVRELDFCLAKCKDHIKRP